jgi:hypothetical protein
MKHIMTAATTTVERGIVRTNVLLYLDPKWQFARPSCLLPQPTIDQAAPRPQFQPFCDPSELFVHGTRCELEIQRKPNEREEFLTVLQEFKFERAAGLHIPAATYG